MRQQLNARRLPEQWQNGGLSELPFLGTNGHVQMDALNGAWREVALANVHAAVRFVPFPPEAAPTLVGTFFLLAFLAMAGFRLTGFANPR